MKMCSVFFLCFPFVLNSVDMASSFMSRGEDDRYDPAGCDMPNEEVSDEATYLEPSSERCSY